MSQNTCTNSTPEYNTSYALLCTTCAETKGVTQARKPGHVTCRRKLILTNTARILAQILARILARILVRILAQILARILSRILARILSRILARILARSLGILAKLHPLNVVNKLANLTDIFHRDHSQSPASLPKESGNLDRKTHRYFF